MQEKGKLGIPRGLVAGYILFVALVSLVAYRLASVWVGHCVALGLLAVIPVGFVSAKARRLTWTVWFITAFALFLSTILILFLNAPEQVRAIEQSKILSFFLGGVTAKVIVSIVVSLILGTVIVLLPILTVVFISSEFVLQMPGVMDISRLDVVRLFLSMIFRTGRPYYIVENGEITQTRPKGLLPKIGGPGLVIIKPYNAVVFERGGNVTRIEGPGRVYPKFMEFAKAVLDLRKQWISWTAENVLTKDHVPLRFHCGVGFRIEAAKDTAKWVKGALPPDQGGNFTGIIAGDYKVYQHTLYRAVYGTTAAGWKLTSQAATETQLQSVVRRYSLEDFYNFGDGDLVADESILNAITAETMSLAQKISPSWGVTITGFKISHFEAPEEMKERLMELWAARYKEKGKVMEAKADKEVMIIRSEGVYRSTILEATAEQKAMEARGKGQADALARVTEVKVRSVEDLIEQLLKGMQGASDGQIDPTIVQRFAQLVEQISRNLLSDTLTAQLYIDALEKIALSGAPTAIALGNLTLESTLSTLPAGSR